MPGATFVLVTPDSVFRFFLDGGVTGRWPARDLRWALTWTFLVGLAGFEPATS